MHALFVDVLCQFIFHAICNKSRYVERCSNSKYYEYTQKTTSNSIGRHSAHSVFLFL